MAPAGPTSSLSNNILVRRSRVLRAISRLNNRDLRHASRNHLLIRSGEILMGFREFCGGWIGKYEADSTRLTPLVFFLPHLDSRGRRKLQRRHVLLDPALTAPAEEVLNGLKPRIIRNISPPLSIPLVPGEISCRSCGIWPLHHRQSIYGAIVLYCSIGGAFDRQETEFLNAAAADLSLALHAQEVSLQLQFERDFTREIIDTIQALMVTITPCGKIVGFNSEAEKTTGYQEKEVLDRYWVDVLLAPDNRLHYQNVVSDLLKNNTDNLSFRATLLSRNGDERTIDWHGSIKPDIDKGAVGMVLFGIDITERLAVDQQYDQALAKWENIFSTIQDPALIVSRNGTILDANHATFTASRKNREEVVGQSVCRILHGGKEKENICPLEQLLATGKSRILHTELTGLHGAYLLTISPLSSTEGTEEASLLVARDMTEEEQHKAEALRAAQLASIGELAAGVAHEINNPINGILNYAQMLQDLDLDGQGAEVVTRITQESKRIATIVRNLLDFSRHRVEAPEPVDCTTVLAGCLELVKHQLHKDHIILETELAASLPMIFINGPQIQQVLLNIISNCRYALNERYPDEDENKRLVIQTEPVSHGTTPYVRITLTDYGTGIEYRVLERVFDPFFSTKPEGMGTGLGLSISYGLVRDNGGYMRLKSCYGKYTSALIDLPVIGTQGACHAESAS